MPTIIITSTTIIIIIIIMLDGGWKTTNDRNANKHGFMYKRYVLSVHILWEVVHNTSMYDRQVDMKEGIGREKK